jgi:hypothetical protein
MYALHMQCIHCTLQSVDYRNMLMFDVLHERWSRYTVLVDQYLLRPLAFLLVQNRG